MSASPEPIPNTTRESSLAAYLRAEPVLLALLFALTVASFSAVTGLSHLYQAQQESLGNRWFARGVADLHAQRFDSAALDFRTALRYSRDNYSYQLNLAEALLGSKRTPEAEAYLINLFDRQPENGFVNLELARIAAQNNDTEHALRYYHNAIYATWSNNPLEDVTARREARVELIEYLLEINANTQAQAELIALQANLGSDPEQYKRLGDLFLRAQDYEHALAAYEVALKAGHHNPAAEAGAGTAAFQLGQYRVAKRYLEAVVAGDASDTKSAALLKTADLVLQLDPNQAELMAAQRASIIARDFSIVGERLKACGLAAGSAGSISSLGTSERNLGDRWMQLKGHVTERAVERDPDLADSAMALVFDAERETAETCGAPQGEDEALWRIAKMRERR